MARSGRIPLAANSSITVLTNVALSPPSAGSYFIPMAQLGGSEIRPPAVLANCPTTAAGVGPANRK